MAKPEPDDNPAKDSSDQEYVVSHLPEDGHISFRKCAACGCAEMKPTSSFAGAGIGSASEHGLVYVCPDCGAEVKMSDSGALVTGVFYSLFWGLVGFWAFHEGPYWYLTHLDYFRQDDTLSYLLLDIGLILFSLAVMALSGWIIWTFLLGPLKTLAQHPITKENRERSPEEIQNTARSKRSSLVSFFIFPLFLWAILLGLFWGLDAVGFDLRENEIIGYAGFGAMLAIGLAVAKRLSLDFTLAFFGMVVWLGVIVAVIFTY